MYVTRGSMLKFVIEQNIVEKFGSLNKMTMKILRMKHSRLHVMELMGLFNNPGYSR